MGLKMRVMPTLLYDGVELVKGTRFDAWRRVGAVMQAVKVYNMRQVDELVFLAELAPDFGDAHVHRPHPGRVLPPPDLIQQLLARDEFDVLVHEVESRFQLGQQVEQIRTQPRDLVRGRGLDALAVERDLTRRRPHEAEEAAHAQIGRAHV